MNPLKANEMPHQEPLVRNKNFLEVATGYDAQTAMDELRRIAADRSCKKEFALQAQALHFRLPGADSYSGFYRQGGRGRL